MQSLAFQPEDIHHSHRLPPFSCSLSINLGTFLNWQTSPRSSSATVLNHVPVMTFLPFLAEKTPQSVSSWLKFFGHHSLPFLIMLLSAWCKV